MCGRFEQSETRRYYARALGADTSDPVKWFGDRTPSYNTPPRLKTSVPYDNSARIYDL
jgi:hypothetical protein